MAVSTKFFGKSKEGKDITLYTITNAAGMQADVTDLGAILVNLFVPGKDGKQPVICILHAPGGGLGGERMVSWRRKDVASGGQTP